MDNKLFDISEWNKKIGEKSHEERFNEWLNDLSSITFKPNKIEQGVFKVNFSNSFRVSKLPSSINIEKDHFKGKDGAGSLFASLLADWDDENVDNEDLGAKYLGTSIVFFPCYSQIDEETRKTKYKKYNNYPSGVIMAMGMGSGGPGPDEKLVSNPGHIRRFEGLIETIKDKFKSEESIVWYREDPLLHKPVPDSFIEKTQKLFDAEPYSLRWRDDRSNGYGQYLYAIVSLKFDENGNFSDEQKEIIKAYASFYARERGLNKNQPNDAAINWYKALYSDESIATIKEKLNRNKYMILAGPPGSKKTDYINQIAEDNKYKDQNLKIQFHPNTTYQSFVGGIQPKLDGNNTSFEFFKGPLIRAIEAANELEKGDYLLVIDEINRADLASVLGEAINLFEPTQKYTVIIPNYNNGGNSNLEMPDNLHVICAMNTADRNISSIDVAIRRRFGYLNIWPNEPLGKNSCDYGRSEFNKMKNLFLEYGNKQDLNLMPGGFYFLGNTDSVVTETIKDRLLPLLEDYLYENRISNLLLSEIELLIQEYRQKL